MIQEYLFIDDTLREKVEKYIPDKATREIHDIDNSTCWIVTYSVSKENEDSAKALSQINKYVVEHFNPTVLTNESSAYYNRKLYPLINEFERKLRKLLYLKSAIYHGEKKIDNIRDLEAKDLGVIFELLFTDAEFVKSIKTRVNEKSWMFTKKEILTVLNDLVEDTVWDNLIGTEAVASLRENFIVAKNYRNDVMHAHNIDTKTFREAKKLFEDINEQLDSEIDFIIKRAEEAPEETADSAFNEALNTALAAQNASDMLKQAYDSIIELNGSRYEGMHEVLHQLQEYYSKPIDYVQLKSAMSPLMDLYNGTEYVQFQKALREFVDHSNIPEYDAFRKQICETVSFYETFRNSVGLNQIKNKGDQIKEAFDSNSTEKTTETGDNTNGQIKNS